MYYLCMLDDKYEAKWPEIEGTAIEVLSEDLHFLKAVLVKP